jgi:hypothetical protein
MAQPPSRPRASLHRVTRTVAAALLVAGGCSSAVRQNMKGQELSFRGAWECGTAGCGEAEMSRSNAGRRDGAMDVVAVALRPRAALLFASAAPFSALEVEVTDCDGAAITLAPAQIEPVDQTELVAPVGSTVVWLDAGQAKALKRSPEGPCQTWIVEATATWADGARYTQAIGVDLR